MAKTAKAAPAKRKYTPRKPGSAGVRLTVVIDTREQLPYSFGPDVKTITRGLETGDYSIQGWMPFVSVERKSWSDFYGCLTKGRVRFENCLVRLSKMRFSAVVVEACVADLNKPYFYRDQFGKIRKSQVPPLVAQKTVIAWMWRYRVPIWFAGNGELSRTQSCKLTCGLVRDGRDDDYWEKAREAGMKWTLLLLDDANRQLVREEREMAAGMLRHAR